MKKKTCFIFEIDDCQDNLYGVVCVFRTKKYEAAQKAALKALLPDAVEEMKEEFPRSYWKELLDYWRVSTISKTYAFDLLTRGCEGEHEGVLYLINEDSEEIDEVDLIDYEVQMK